MCVPRCSSRKVLAAAISAMCWVCTGLKLPYTRRSACAGDPGAVSAFTSGRAPENPRAPGGGCLNGPLRLNRARAPQAIPLTAGKMDRPCSAAKPSPKAASFHRPFTEYIALPKSRSIATPMTSPGAPEPPAHQPSAKSGSLLAAQAVRRASNSPFFLRGTLRIARGISKFQVLVLVLSAI